MENEIGHISFSMILIHTLLRNPIQIIKSAVKTRPRAIMGAAEEPVGALFASTASITNPSTSHDEESGCAALGNPFPYPSDWVWFWGGDSFPAEGL